MTQSPQMTTPKTFMRDTFIPRVLRSFASSLDGEVAWMALLNSLDDEERPNYHRLNVKVPGILPGPDDVASMDLLAVAVRSDPKGPRQRREVIIALLVSSFYLELDGLPEDCDGMVRYSGSIRCRLRPSAVISLISALHRMHPDGLEFVNTDGSTAHALTENDVCRSCGAYRKPVKARARSLKDPIVYTLRSRSFHTLGQISSMPNSLAWFIEMQELDRPFGSANHGNQFRAQCRYCSRASGPEADHATGDATVAANAVARPWKRDEVGTNQSRTQSIY